MAGVNRVFLLGHLGRDPEMHYQPSGAAIATLNMATLLTDNRVSSWTIEFHPEQ